MLYISAFFLQLQDRIEFLARQQTRKTQEQRGIFTTFFPSSCFLADDSIIDQNWFAVHEDHLHEIFLMVEFFMIYITTILLQLSKLHVLTHTGVAYQKKVLEYRLSTPMIQSVLSVNECVCAYSM